MNQVAKNILLLLMATVFLGCPYESIVPMDENKITIKKELLGTWEEPSSENSVFYQVAKFDEYHYKIERSFSNLSKAPDKYVAHLSELNGISFLNLRPVDDFSLNLKKTKPSDNKIIYYLYKITYKGGMISLAELSDKIQEKFHSQPELLEFISKNMSKSYFYNRKEILLINKYQIEKTARQNIELNKNNEIQEIKIKESKTLNSVLIISMLLLLLLITFLSYYFRSKQITNKLLTEKKEISAMLDGQEAERERIAIDLHDRLGSMLATVKLYFSSMEDQLELLKKNNIEQYEKASNLLDEACDEVRKIAHDLSSGSISRFGLVSALNELKDTISKTNKLKVAVFSYGLETRLDPELETSLYRIIQELLSNTIKHAKAQTIIIQLTRTNDHLNIFVEDDGEGFDEKTETQKKGIGLANIQSRLSKYNGLMKIDSKIKKGTRIIIDIPLTNQRKEVYKNSNLKT